MNSLSNSISSNRLPGRKYRLVESVRKSMMGTFSRPSKKWVENELGILTEVADHEPAWVHENGICKGLSIEKSATNLFTFSDDFTNNVWVKSKSSIIPNEVIAPDETLTASKLVSDLSDTDIRLQRSGWLPAGVYTTHIYVKSAELNTIRLYGVDFSTSTLINLDSVTANGAGSIKDIGNGWKKCSITVAFSGGATQLMYLNLGTGGNVNSGDGVYIWRAQLELNSFATSTIYTEDSVATRSADELVIEGQDLQNFYNHNEGTFVAKYSTFDVLAGESRHLLQSYSSSTNRYSVYWAADSKPLLYGRNTVGDSIDAAFPNTAPNSGEFIKVALRKSGDNFDVFGDGLKGVTQTLNITENVSNISIGFRGYASNGYLNGVLEYLDYYPKGLSDQRILKLIEP